MFKSEQITKYAQFWSTRVLISEVISVTFALAKVKTVEKIVNFSERGFDQPLLLPVLRLQTMSLSLCCTLFSSWQTTQSVYGWPVVDLPLADKASALGHLITHLGNICGTWKC